MPKLLQLKYLQVCFRYFFVWKYILANAKTIVIPFSGVIFKYIWQVELLLKMRQIQVIVIPYGADAYMYSKVKDKALQNGLLISYPEAARNELNITKQVFFWSRFADVIVSVFMACDGMPRSDVVTPFPSVINTRDWYSKKHYSSTNGANGCVKILHTPNHRGFKGTEYLIKAVNELQNEGLQVELILLEKVANAEVKIIMQEVDILAEQFIATGYAQSGIEGMASCLPVLANFENPDYIKIFRYYSFLDECPIVSTSIKTLKENLKVLIKNPELRTKLGGAGRSYVEKYHSYKTAQFLFTNILQHLDQGNLDLINLFHPLKSEYVKQNKIVLPLLNEYFNHEE